MDEDQLSEQDFEFVSENSHKLSFLEKIEKDEMDQWAFAVLFVMTLL